jgi:hypothetical protein
MEHYFGAFRTVRNNPAIPISNTAVSIRTDVLCNRSNSTRKGLSFGVESTETIADLNSARRGITRVCVTMVSANIKTTPIIAGCRNALTDCASANPATKYKTAATIPK